jgi:hypothetical protein
MSELKSIARSFDIKKIYKINKECLIKKIKKQQPYRTFQEDIFKGDIFNSSLNNNPFQKFEKAFFNEENYFNSSLEKTPQVYELIDVIQMNKKIPKEI